ncbi:MAG TPA: glycosyltransferase [Trueperaceae bacterium]|nr:glycosyltransferase [Trueperaceae bacterium]
MVIPAYNEEDTVAGIAKIALETNLGLVLVVDDGSTDKTKENALASGAAVMQIKENVGKGGAVWLAANSLQTKVIVLIDADLTGLNSQHIIDLAEPVLADKVDMTRGNFSGGRWQTTAAQNITPQLNGQRGILREKLIALPDFSKTRYGIEIAITNGAKKHKWRTANIDLKDVSQVMKEEKRGFWAGLETRLGMYRDIIKTWFTTATNK